jgi:hypothetical protein
MANTVWYLGMPSKGSRSSTCWEHHEQFHEHGNQELHKPLPKDAQIMLSGNSSFVHLQYVDKFRCRISPLAAKIALLFFVRSS